MSFTHSLDFLDLPYEVRAKIYRHYFDNSTILIRHAPGNITFNSAVVEIFRFYRNELLRVSRAIRAEAEPFKKMHFSVFFDDARSVDYCDPGWQRALAKEHLARQDREKVFRVHVNGYSLQSPEKWQEMFLNLEEIGLCFTPRCVGGITADAGRIRVEPGRAEIHPIVDYAMQEGVKIHFETQLGLKRRVEEMSLKGIWVRMYMTMDLRVHSQQRFDTVLIILLIEVLADGFKIIKIPPRLNEDTYRAYRHKVHFHDFLLENGHRDERRFRPVNKYKESRGIRSIIQTAWDFGLRLGGS